jgi:hypothetical protein
VHSRDGKFIKTNWNGDPNEPLKGFEFKHGRTAHTNGVHMWSDIFLYDAPNGEKIAIILIDTQGLFEPSRPATENARIFGLSNLISSIQIYNLFQVVQENELEYLEMTVKLSELIANKVKAIKGGAKEYKPFQNLVFLIRDWADEDFGIGYEAGNKYLHEEVLSLNTNNKAAQSVRKNIHKSFEKINGYLLPFPGEAIRTTGFDGRWKNLNRKFVTSLEQLIESMFLPKNLMKKKIFDIEVTGETYRQYINDYFELFKSDDIPQVESLLHMTIGRQMQILMEKLTAEFKTRIETSIDFDDEHLIRKIQAKHDALKANIFKQFNEADSLADDETKEQYKKFLDGTIEKFYEDWKKQITQRYEEHRRNVLMVEEMRRNHEEQTRKMQAEAEEHQKQIQAELDEKLKSVAAENKEEREKLIRESAEKDKKFQAEMNQRLKEAAAQNDKIKKELEQKAKEQQQQLQNNFNAQMEKEREQRKKYEEDMKQRLAQQKAEHDREIAEALARTPPPPAKQHCIDLIFYRHCW